MKNTLIDLFRALPKTELHVHLEGTLEADFALMLAQRNGIDLPYATEQELRAAYRFADLETFLSLYQQITGVLRTEQDFYELLIAYCKRAHQDGIVHIEPFIDPQIHLEHGVPLATIMNGLRRAQDEALTQYGITSAFIICFLRDKPVAPTFDILAQSLEFQDQIIGVGLSSAERGHPAEPFKELFTQARAYGYHTVAHAGEAFGPASIYQALEYLQAERIDHGISCLEDPQLVQLLIDYEIPLTVCPVSNVALNEAPSLAQHPIMQLLQRGIIVTLNSDDPAYFGAYLDDVAAALINTLPITADIIHTLCQNSIRASFLPEERKLELMRLAHNMYEQWLTENNETLL